AKSPAPLNGGQGSCPTGVRRRFRRTFPRCRSRGRLLPARPTGTSGLGRDGLLHLDDADPLALLAVGLEDDHAAHPSVQGVVPAAAHVAPGRKAGAPLTHQNAARAHPLAAETLHAKPLGGAVPSVAGAAPGLLGCEALQIKGKTHHVSAPPFPSRRSARDTCRGYCRSISRSPRTIVSSTAWTARSPTGPSPSPPPCSGRRQASNPSPASVRTSTPNRWTSPITAVWVRAATPAHTMSEPRSAQPLWPTA